MFRPISELLESTYSQALYHRRTHAHTLFNELIATGLLVYTLLVYNDVWLGSQSFEYYVKNENAARRTFGVINIRRIAAVVIIFVKHKYLHTPVDSMIFFLQSGNTTPIYTYIHTLFVQQIVATSHKVSSISSLIRVCPHADRKILINSFQLCFNYIGLFGSWRGRRGMRRICEPFTITCNTCK